MKFINCHQHSEYSFLDGLSTVEEIFKISSELGHAATVISDHASVSCFPEMLKYSKKYGVKGILACEFYVVMDNDLNLGKKNEQRFHFIAIAQNWKGCQSIFKKLTLANQKKFNGRPRLLYSQLFDFDNCYITLACAISMLTLPNYEEIALKFQEIYNTNFFLEIIYAKFLNKQIKGSEVEQHDQAKEVNLKCIELHKKHNISLLATTDSHFSYKHQAKAFEVMLAIQTKSKMNQATVENGGKRFFFGDNEIYIKDGIEVYNDLMSLGYIEESIIKQAINNTNIIANNCNIEIPKFQLNLPNPYQGDEFEIFKTKIKEGFYRLGLDKKPNAQEYKDRIEYEIKIIKEVGFVNYFLILTDIMDFCRRENIPVGSSRGSAGSSIVLLCLGVIRKIDAIKYKLSFSRFINIHRISFPDADLDFSSSQKYRVIDYLKGKYGNDKVCGISTFTYLSAKNAFRDVCSAFNFESSEINRLSKLIEEGSIKENGKIVGKYSRIESFDYIPELIKFKAEYPELFEIISILDGRIRGTGCHAAGQIVSSIPIQEMGVIENKKGGMCISWDKVQSEEIFKLLKLDALSLQTVDVCYKACELVSQRHNINLTPDDIPLEDEKTSALLASGDCKLIFQFESPISQHFLKEAGQGTLEVCAGLSASIRPGTLHAVDKEGISETQHYVNRLNGKEEPKYLFPELEPILAETKGVLLYQESVTQIVQTIAGFNEMEADLYRKTIGKKLPREQFETYRNDFVERSWNHSKIPKDKSNQLFDIFLESSSYLFNKIHSVGYAILTYESAFLKAHFPIEFYCANLTYSDDDKRQIYIQDAKLHNIEIRTPDINISHSTDFIIHDEVIYAPLSISKYVGTTAAESITSIRTTPFIDMNDFNNRINQLPKRPNKRAMASLFYSNAFKSLNHYEKDPKKAAEKMLEYLPIFSPLPYIDLTQNIDRDFNQIKSIANTIKQCAKEEYIKPLGKPSNVLCILEVGKQENQLMEVNTWFKSELEKRLNTQICVISPSGCKDLCQNKCIDKLESFIQSIKPLLILNCSSKTSKIFGYKFGETFGNINYVEKFDCHLINIPSPAYMGYKKDVKEIYRNKIIPLLENYKIKTEIA